MGKPKQKHEVDITENIQLTADQIDTLVVRHLPQIVEMYKSEIAGLLSEATLSSRSSQSSLRRPRQPA
jgi:hypothetical protein